jgi:hypothetical protein
MSTATATQADSGAFIPTPAEQTPLEAAVEVTQQRIQSIRATAAQFLGVPPDKVCSLLRNVWRTSKGEPELTDNEMFAGMSMIARYGLDPIAKEIYVTRSSKGLMTIIGIDGFVKILDRTDGYDGFEQEMGWNGDDLEWVETRIYSGKRTHPTTYRAFASEYARLAGIVAKSIPWHMLRLFSLRHATRLFTPIGGSVVTEEEARWMNAYQPTATVLPQKTSRTESLAERLTRRNEPNRPANGERSPDVSDANQEPPASDPLAAEERQLQSDQTEREYMAEILPHITIQADADKTVQEIDARTDLGQDAKERIKTAIGKQLAKATRGERSNKQRSIVE